MRQGTLFRRYEVFVAAACMASHANAPADGFRQRDVRFLIELFTNWVESPLFHTDVPLNNTQVSRYLDTLAEQGYAWRTQKRGAPLYRLSRVGLLELLTRILPGPRFVRSEQFAFIYYFLANYRERLLKVIESEGKQFPTALRLEVEALLDVPTLLRDQLRYAQMELQKLDEQIRDAKKGSKLASELFSVGHATKDVAREVEKLYPYQLNSQKPLSQLMSEIPGDLARWELEHGGQRRVDHLWVPVRNLLATHIEYLRSLSVPQDSAQSRMPRKGS